MVNGIEQYEFQNDCAEFLFDKTTAADTKQKKPLFPRLLSHTEKGLSDNDLLFVNLYYLTDIHLMHIPVGIVFIKYGSVNKSFL